MLGGLSSVGTVSRTHTDTPDSTSAHTTCVPSTKALGFPYQYHLLTCGPLAISHRLCFQSTDPERTLVDTFSVTQLISEEGEPGWGSEWGGDKGTSGTPHKSSLF